MNKKIIILVGILFLISGVIAYDSLTLTRVQEDTEKAEIIKVDYFSTDKTAEVTSIKQVITIPCLLKSCLTKNTLIDSSIKIIGFDYKEKTIYKVSYNNINIPEVIKEK